MTDRIDSTICHRVMCYGMGKFNNVDHATVIATAQIIAQA